MNFLETEDVVKQYANHLALNKVSIQVPEGKYRYFQSFPL